MSLLPKDERPVIRQRAALWNHAEFIAVEEARNRAANELKAAAHRKKEAKLAGKEQNMQDKAKRKQLAEEKRRVKLLGQPLSAEGKDQINKLRTRTEKFTAAELEKRKSITDNEVCSKCNVWWSDFKQLRDLVWQCCGSCSKVFCIECWQSEEACCELKQNK